MKTFAIIGAAGYIAPRHMRAIKETGNELVAALDKSDSVGIIDSYFPDARFFTEFERFDRHVDKARRAGQRLDFVSIASPNYLHDSHIRFALRSGAHAICEKPLVLNPWNIDGLEAIERETGLRVYNILQLRLHPAIVALRERVRAAVAADPGKTYDIKLTYVTSRGNWYFRSWKGDLAKSGGIATNIGIHFFDMLSWIFGPPRESRVHVSSPDTAAGFLELAHARVRWLLSVDYGKLPEAAKAAGQRTFRSIDVDGEEIDFSGGFTDLHTLSYRHILDGEGFSMQDARQSIEIVQKIREAPTVPPGNDAHPDVHRLYG